MVDGTDAETHPAAVTRPPSIGTVLISFAMVGLGLLFAHMLASSGFAAEAIHTSSSATTFVVLLVLAAAVERLLEPLMQRLPGAAASASLEQVRSAALVSQGPDGLMHWGEDVDAEAIGLLEVARAQAAVARAKASRAVLAWGLATFAATVGSAACGFYLLHAIAGPGWSGIPLWADALVTGLIVGSGTKPVHDLVTLVQNKS
jgi:hypothetical protein